ncbi:peroxiredoxin [Pseudomonas sp. S75]|uniref:peroxiredoxin n=1 Tax=unclassified Pseudomonas TaxID=196821 RepID=UPI00190312FB|nr:MULTISPECIES: peroxiredoxin [unclassified Pseudomonas]MBJ9977658.1 peroxiredoxin [Pseudomonas sp. S30]MBK0155030.1 peroxiredoxin [Pseudomonas sp. S75]
MIKPGDALPDVILHQYNAQEGVCAVGPAAFSLRERCAGRRVLIFGLPGAFTPTCSQRHVPGYVAAAQALFDAGIDEILCLSVNDAFVMQAWGEGMGTAELVQMIADGNGLFTQACGLGQDLSGRGMGYRSLGYAMLVDDGVVRHLAIEAAGQFEVSDAQSLLAVIRAA